MKDIKSLIIGFLLATCMFLFMGQTSNISNSPIEVKIIEQPLADFNRIMKVKIVEQPPIKVEPKGYNGFRIRE